MCLWVCPLNKSQCPLRPVFPLENSRLLPGREHLGVRSPGVLSSEASSLAVLGWVEPSDWLAFLLLSFLEKHICPLPTLSHPPLTKQGLFSQGSP